MTILHPLVAVLLLLTVSACAPKTITIPPQATQEKPVQAPVALPDQSLTGQAERAWTSNNMAEAERLYGILSRSPETAPDQLKVVLERYVQAALVNRHAQSALDGLDQLRRVDPNSVSHGVWQRQLGQALLLLPPSEALRRAAGAAGEASMPATLRGQAAAVALLTASAAEKVPWMEALNRLYQNTTPAERQLMERGLYTLLPGVAGADLAALVDYSLPDTDQVYPWSVFLLEQARREGRKQGAAPTAAGVPAVERLGKDSIFADTALRGEVMGGTFTAGLTASGASTLTSATTPAGAAQSGSDVPMSSGCVVLALPTSGNFAAVGSRVALGAETAKHELAGRGIKAEVVVLNTEDPGWLTQLAALPPQCVVVGGPLTMPAYSAAKAAGALQQKAFFTFTSSLEGDDEGKVAWRFFSSPEDQVSAMLRMAGAVGVDTFGVLYPEEPYGHRMVELFKQGAGSRVVNSAGYSPSDPQSWNGVTKSLVGGGMRGEVPVSSARFQGLFMPDSWDKSASLIPFLFFHGEDRLLLMGTALWEQGITRTRLDPSNLTLVIFPGGWNSISPTASASTLISSAQAAGQTADSWMGLGYDFVRFALAMNLTAMPASAEVNTRIQSAARMGFSIAPLSWTPDGRARQHMFVFSPTADGSSVELVHPDTLKQKLEQVRARYERRLNTLK